MTLGAIISFSALLLFKEFGGWYALVIGLLFVAEMYFSRSGWFEIGAPVLFTVGAFLILRDFNVDESAYHLLAYSLVWLISDLLAYLTFPNPRPLSLLVRGVGAFLVLINYGFLFFENDNSIAVIGFGIYTLLFLTISLLYRRPILFYAFTLSLPLFVTFVFREFDVTKWIHPVIILAVLYYAAGYFLRAVEAGPGLGSVPALQRAGAGSHRFVGRTSCRRVGCGNPRGSGGDVICSGGLREEKCLAGFPRKWFVSAGVFHHPLSS